MDADMPISASSEQKLQKRSDNPDSEDNKCNQEKDIFHKPFTIDISVCVCVGGCTKVLYYFVKCIEVKNSEYLFLCLQKVCIKVILAYTENIE